MVTFNLVSTAAHKLQAPNFSAQVAPTQLALLSFVVASVSMFPDASDSDSMESVRAAPQAIT